MTSHDFLLICWKRCLAIHSMSNVDPTCNPLRVQCGPNVQSTPCPMWAQRAIHPIIRRVFHAPTVDQPRHLVESIFTLLCPICSALTHALLICSHSILWITAPFGMRVGSTHQLTARVLLSHDASTNSPIGWVVAPQLVRLHLALRRALHCLASSCLALPCDMPCPALTRLVSRRLSLPCLAHAIFKKLSSDHLYTLSDS
jgi:hypothetical protein